MSQNGFCQPPAGTRASRARSFRSTVPLIRAGAVPGGQELLRRPRIRAPGGDVYPRQSYRGRDRLFRGSVLDVEPAFGATNGLYRNPGYANCGINITTAGPRPHGLRNLRNSLNRHYEEVLGILLRG